MRKVLSVIGLLGVVLINGAWLSESGSGVVSDGNVQVLASIEATEVLQSNTLGLFYVENRFGGASNYSSTDSGGVFSTRNVTSSVDVVRLGNNDFLAWLNTSESWIRVGVSDDDVFTIASNTDIQGATSQNSAQVDGTLDVSGNTSIVGRFILGSTQLASDVTTIAADSGSVFITNDNTTGTEITSITGAGTDQMIYVYGGGDNFGTSFSDAGVFNLNADIRLSKDDALVLRASDDATFIEISRSNN